FKEHLLEGHLAIAVVGPGAGGAGHRDGHGDGAAAGDKGGILLSLLRRALNEARVDVLRVQVHSAPCNHSAPAVLAAFAREGWYAWCSGASTNAAGGAVELVVRTRPAEVGRADFG